MRDMLCSSYIASEQLALSPLMENHVLLKELFYKNADYTLAAFKKFRLLMCMKKACGMMSAKGLKNMIQTFNETGSFQLKSGSWNNSIASTSVEDVTTVLEEGTSFGVHTCSAVHGDLPDLLTCL